jgi:hypothetical protein
MNVEKKKELEKVIERLGGEFQGLLKTHSDISFALAEFTRRLITLAETNSGEDFIKVGESYGRLLAMYLHHQMIHAQVIEDAFALAVDLVVQFGNEEKRR